LVPTKAFRGPDRQVDALALIVIRSHDFPGHQALDRFCGIHHAQSDPGAFVPIQPHPHFRTALLIIASDKLHHVGHCEQPALNLPRDALKPLQVGT
jgi:hypothetical protein